MTKVTVDHLERSYGAVRVLKDISLEIDSGEFVVLLGPSGCGKSTLLNSIAGLDDIQGGHILFDDDDVTIKEPSQREIGMVFQSYALYPTMTARQNMSFAMSVAGASRADQDERVHWAAQLLQIESLLDRRPGQLSGGQRQRVAIGRALVRQARLFLFDEPLSNLDARLRNEMRGEIKALHEKLKTTFIYVTHDQIEAMTLADRIAVMNAGEIQQSDSPDEIYRRPSTRFVAEFIGSPAINILSARIENRADGPAVVFDKGTVPLTDYRFLAAQPDGPVDFGVRPERVTLSRDKQPGWLPVRMESIEPHGADSLIWLRLGEQKLSARISPDAVHNLSDEVYVDFDFGGVSLFDPASGARL